MVKAAVFRTPGMSLDDGTRRCSCWLTRPRPATERPLRPPAARRPGPWRRHRCSHRPASSPTLTCPPGLKPLATNQPAVLL